MKINGNGFLNAALPDLSETVPLADHAKFLILKELVGFGESLKNDLKISGQETLEEKQKVIAVVVFVRLLEVVEAITILAAYGIREELLSLFRVFLDAYFIQANCCSDVHFISNFLKTDEKSRLTLMNAASKYDSGIFKSLNEYATDEIRDDLADKIKEENIRRIQSFEYAKNVNCQEIYDSIYRLYSSSIHTTPRCLSNYVQASHDGKISLIHHGPDSEITDQIVYDLSLFFIKSMRGLCELFELFELDRAAALRDFEKQME